MGCVAACPHFSRECRARRGGGAVVLKPKPQLNLDNAKGYFREHLAVGDYYMDGNVVAGEWRGAGAAMLGLDGAVSEKAFVALCEGLNPETGQRLTARMNTTRFDGERTVSNRRVFYDFTISPPKSVSVVALYQDARIIKIHDEAVRVMVDELERRAETRVRVDGANEERETRNCIAALFRHETSRELDPHLHTHCIFLNATYDSVEEKWKALHATGMYRAQKMAEHLYYHELAKGLRSLGYEIENNARDFEIKGVPREVIARFSKRHQQIDAETKKRIAEGGLAGAGGNEKELREQVAHDKRRRKIKNAVAAALRPRWEAEMPPAERDALGEISPRELPPPLPYVVGQKPNMPSLVAWADRHVFERKSATTDSEFLGAALAFGRGENFSLGELEEATVEAIGKSGLVISEDGRKMTNREVLEAELQCALRAELNAQKFKPLNYFFKPDAALSKEQNAAVVSLLRNQDLVMLFRGGAGTGKSFTLREVVRGLREKQHRVVVAAPQHQQVRDLRNDGLGDAITLTRLLTMEGWMPENAVVIVDEAGQIGGKDMLALIKKVQAANGRLILSGDTQQQGPVAATDALRVIEEHTNIRPVCLTEIHRQDPSLGHTHKERAFIRAYRDAVQSAAECNFATSFDQLDKIGCIREAGAETLIKEIATHYREAVQRKENALALTQTWGAVHTLNDAIRVELKRTGILKNGTRLASWQAIDLTEAQKRDARFYAAGEGVFFLRDYGRFHRGDFCEIISADVDGVTLRKNGRNSAVSHSNAAACLAPVRTREIELAHGDRLQMKFNGKSVEGALISNGELVTVRRVFKDGRIAVRDDEGKPKTLSPSQRMFVPGYAVTSYASQGKTVDVVLAAYMADETAPVTTNRNQWYVAISRARRKALVFTEDKVGLRASVERLGERDAALSVGPSKDTAMEVAQAFSEETKELLEIGMQAQRHAAVMRWADAAHQQTAQQTAQVRPSVSEPPPLPNVSQPQHQTRKGIRI